MLRKEAAHLPSGQYFIQQTEIEAVAGQIGTRPVHKTIVSLGFLQQHVRRNGDE
jgi:hypothetical protein